MVEMKKYVLPINTTDDSLDRIGGKGQSLSKMASAGMAVPDGFQLTTAAYTDFVAANDLQAKIVELARPTVADGIVSFSSAAKAIQQLFVGLHPLPEIEAEIREAYAALEGDEPAVAVRSSANAEDLPGLSFAGQQETYLNVCGIDALLTAVRDCWASLWTPQAIGYRFEMGIDQDAVAMAVVIQLMVPSDVSGILFTANPATGERSEIIINASFGLGEAVVSGQVTPDTYVVDRDSMAVTERMIGAKEQMIVSDERHGIRMEDVGKMQRESSSLSDGAITELATLALGVEELFYGDPRDIEWAISDDKVWLLQARPITNLPEPPPKDVTWPEIPGAQLLKRQVAENMPNPLSPLFDDLYLRAIFDSQTWPEDWEWKGRLTRNYGKNFVITTVNGYAYQPIYIDNSEDWGGYMKHYNEEQAKLSWFAKLKGVFSMQQYLMDDMKGGPLHGLYLIGRTFRTFRKYPALVRWEKQQLPDYLEVIERWQAVDPAGAADEGLLTGMKSLVEAEAYYWHSLRAVIGTAKMTDGKFQSFIEENAGDEEFISGTFLSGFASRTLDAEVAMRAIAQSIRDNPSLNELTIVTPAPRVLDAIRDHANGASVHKAIETYLHIYGRQVFNLDFVEPSLAEESVPFAMSLKALVGDSGYDLAARRKAVRKERRSKFLTALKFFKGKMKIEFIQLYWTARINYPFREEALFYMGLAWSTFRPFALELGMRLVETGTLGEPDDIFYLTREELEESLTARKAGRALPHLGENATAQRTLRAQRFRMDQPPAIPPVEKDDNPFSVLRNNEGDANILRGFAVSPGTVTGIASVIMTPNDFDQMKPRTILVCPLTTPAWTQLFPHVAGLVTDIGSILAHGSIVAREYGIPAVLGTGNCTQRIKSGDRISVEGSKGVVTILSDD